MRLTTFLCILGQIILSQNGSGFVCEDVEDLTEGEILVTGDEVIFDGVTEVEGNVPMSGNVVFEGPVRASGTVTIVGTSRPMLPAFGLGSAMGPQMMLPPCYFSYPLYPNICSPVPDNISLGYGNIEALGDDVSVVGETLVEGTVPISGNICFDGGVPAYGKVKIFAQF